MTPVQESKLTYHKPVITVYGDVEEITQTKCLAWSTDDFAGQTVTYGKFTFTVPTNAPGGCALGS